MSVQLSSAAKIQQDITKYLTTKLIYLGISQKDLDSQSIRTQTVFYQIYWYNRLKNNPEEQHKIYTSLVNYLFYVEPNKYTVEDLSSILADEILTNNANYYVEQYLQPVKTVDLVISPKQDLHTVLCVSRSWYPLGLALPGGFVLDTDEDNPLSVRKELYAALRVLSQKILKNQGEPIVTKTVNTNGNEVFSVSNADQSVTISIEPLFEKGFVFKEIPKEVLRPSDPRHIVDTIAFRCIISGELVLDSEQGWYQKSDLMDTQNTEHRLVFGHHRELINQITAQSSLQIELELEEAKFIQGILHDPYLSYKSFVERFEKNKNNVNTSFPELFAVVKQLITKMYTEEINLVCRFNTTLSAIRDKATIALRHVSLKNRVFCPYLPTLKAIFEGVAFFDIYAREKKSFYAGISKEKIHEHNPKQLSNSSYHMYRYKYRMDDLLSKIPHEIIIPTFEAFSAIELMMVRCVPIRFIGLSTDFIYVDEFEQSPEEFMMHDINHNWRMMSEDKDAMLELGIDAQTLYKQSEQFSKQCLADFKIKKTDTKDEIELKKIKRIILFEVVHEDARPFLPQIINKYIQLKEGSEVKFEVPRIDPVTSYMDIVDTLDTGISTLSYVRNKLQYGFYDQVDNQRPELVDPLYRTAEWIARAAYELLIEYKAVPNPLTEVDSNGHIDYEWLLKRACAVGPDNIHNTEYIDPAVLKYGDGAQKLNPKRYQTGGVE
jgi:hypothetical protein